MPDFSNLKKQEVDQDYEREFTLSYLEGEPVLLVVSATQSNKAYFNARLKAMSKFAGRSAGAKIDVTKISEIQDDDRELMAKHVVRGWKNVLDAKGQAVEFNLENCEAFLDALPRDMFMDLKAFTENPDNFRAAHKAAATGEDLGKS